MIAHSGCRNIFSSPEHNALDPAAAEDLDRQAERLDRPAGRSR